MIYVLVYAGTLAFGMFMAALIWLSFAAVLAVTGTVWGAVAAVRALAQARHEAGGSVPLSDLFGPAKP